MNEVNINICFYYLKVGIYVKMGIQNDLNNTLVGSSLQDVAIFWVSHILLKNM